MDLLESNDPKAELLKKSAMYRQDLEAEVKTISERSERIITNALIIGGTLAVAYLLVRQFSGSSFKKNSKGLKAMDTSKAETNTSVDGSSSPGIASQIGSALASHVAVFLLTIAKEKLSEYLQAQFEKEK